MFSQAFCFDITHACEESAHKQTYACGIYRHCENLSGKICDLALGPYVRFPGNSILFTHDLANVDVVV